MREQACLSFKSNQKEHHKRHHYEEKAKTYENQNFCRKVQEERVEAI